MLMIYIYNEIINIHNKKYYLYAVKCNFNLNFDKNFSPCIESNLYTNKTIKLKSKNKHLKSNLHIDLAKSFHINYSLENPIFFDVDDIYNQFVNIHIKKYYLYAVKCNFNLIFDNNFVPCNECDFYMKKKQFVVGIQF